MEAPVHPVAEPEMERPTKFGNVRLSEFEVSVLPRTRTCYLNLGDPETWNIGVLATLACIAVVAVSLQHGWLSPGRPFLWRGA